MSKRKSKPSASDIEKPAPALEQKDTWAGRAQHLAADEFAKAHAQRVFELYPEERHWWSFNDYGAVLDVVLALGAKRILEFGPGSSTLALIEGGATHIDTFEDDPHWAKVYRERLVARFPGIVHLYEYRFGRPGEFAIERVGGTGTGYPIQGPYDLALIDGPIDLMARLTVLDICLLPGNAAAVLVPIDDSPALVQKLLALETGPFTVRTFETGPLAGAFALVTHL